MGERYYRKRRDEDIIPLDGFTTLDLALTKDFGEYAQVFTRLDNILGEEDIEDEPGLDGTEFLAGLRMSF